MKQGPWRITFDTNPDDCNLSCIMCEDHSPYSMTQRNRIDAGLRKRRMSFELIEKIISEAKPLGLKEIIPSTMGEPLIYKDFDKIIKLCHQYDIKLNLTTNGTFPVKGVEVWSNLIVPVTSDVKFSWNGATKKTQELIMKKSNWEKVLLNLKTFIAIRNQHAESGGNYCRVTLQLTFLEENVDELADIIEFAINLGVDRVKGHHLWVHFKEMADSDMCRNSEAIHRWNEAVKKAHYIRDSRLLANGKKILLENIYPLNPVKVEDFETLGECPFLGKEAWIATDGRFNPCCAPDKERKTLGEFGNLNQMTLDTIWQSRTYNTLIENYTKQTLCQKCNMRKKATL